MALPEARGAGVNAAHALQAMFIRRLLQGRSKYVPCLGWKEFLPSYFGMPRDHSAADPGAPHLQRDLDLLLPAFLLSVWDAPTNGRYEPVFQELRIIDGKLAFPRGRFRNGSFEFSGDLDAD